jgi:hypothetical protein
VYSVQCTYCTYCLLCVANVRVRVRVRVGPQSGGVEPGLEDIHVDIN